MEKDSCRGVVYLFVYVIIPPLFLYFLPFCYPYILLHFKCFLLLVQYLVGGRDLSLWARFWWLLEPHLL